MVTATKSTKESEDLAAIQAQLQLERAKLTSEISTRLGSISPSKPNGTLKNPFSMPSSKDVSSPFASSSSSPSFTHRPATLGLGAEPSEQDRKQAVNGAENARLKGAIVGKRKRDVQEGSAMRSDDDQEDSKTSAIQKGKAKEVARSKGMADPFASKKSKVKSKEAVVAPKPASVAIVPPQVDLAGLSKAARKRLRKKMLKEAQANERTDAATGGDASDDDEDGDGSTSHNIEPASNGNGHLEDTQGMTSHQKSLLSHLSGARFRQINETLYTTSSSSAIEYIRGEPLKLQEYHEGFREQVKGWPKVPVRQIAEMLQKGQAEGGSKKGKSGSGRHAPGALVVDLGAGEAILAKLMAKDKSSSIRVLSYDLLDSEDGWVRGLDIAKLNGLGLPGTLAENIDDEQARIVDVAVFCLSLMGTNWVEMIMEASRVLRKGGDLIIAEVTSRFNTKADFISIVSSLGFKMIREDSSNSHFVLFEFVKLAKDQCRNLSDNDERTRITEEGSSVLKPCIYKRR